MSDKVCVVAGVGPGTGAALSRRFAAGGYRVAMLARDASRLAALEREIAGSRGYACDVTDAAQVKDVTLHLRLARTTQVGRRNRDAGENVLSEHRVVRGRARAHRREQAAPGASYAAADAVEIEERTRVHECARRVIQREAPGFEFFEDAAADEVAEHAAERAGVDVRGGGEIINPARAVGQMFGNTERRHDGDAPLLG